MIRIIPWEKVQISEYLKLNILIGLNAPQFKRPGCQMVLLKLACYLSNTISSIPCLSLGVWRSTCGALGACLQSRCVSEALTYSMLACQRARQHTHGAVLLNTDSSSNLSAVVNTISENKQRIILFACQTKPLCCYFPS